MTDTTFDDFPGWLITNDPAYAATAEAEAAYRRRLHAAELWAEVIEAEATRWAGEMGGDEGEEG